MTPETRSWDGNAVRADDLSFSEPFIWFVRILFVVIIGNGFRTFSVNFSFERFINTPTVTLLTVLAYFIAGYFFVISDFVFYQLQMMRYPYPKGTVGRFFEDIVIFFVLFLLLDLASVWPSPRKVWAFVFLAALWHFLVTCWQLHVNAQYERLWKRGMSHGIRTAMYVLLWVLYTVRQATVPPPATGGAEESVNAVMGWVWIVVMLIGLSNGVRLYTFARPTSRLAQWPRKFAGA